MGVRKTGLAALITVSMDQGLKTLLKTRTSR